MCTYVYMQACLPTAVACLHIGLLACWLVYMLACLHVGLFVCMCMNYSFFTYISVNTYLHKLHCVYMCLHDKCVVYIHTVPTFTCTVHTYVHT